MAELDGERTGRRSRALTAARRRAAASARRRRDRPSSPHLAMGQATVDVAVDAARPPASARHGVDEVEILLAANPGARRAPLDKGASGGELSRVMLAVEVVAAAGGRVPDLVFDEVDAGVGGAAAVEVGRPAGRASPAHAQVIVVTHLPQVAAFADRHLVVAQGDDGHVTAAASALDDEERVPSWPGCWPASTPAGPRARPGAARATPHRRAPDRRAPLPRVTRPSPRWTRVARRTRVGRAAHAVGPWEDGQRCL